MSSDFDVMLHQFLEAFGSCHLRFPSAYAALASFVVLPISASINITNFSSLENYQGKGISPILV